MGNLKDQQIMAIEEGDTEAYAPGPWEFDPISKQIYRVMTGEPVLEFMTAPGLADVRLTVAAPNLLATMEWAHHALSAGRIPRESILMQLSAAIARAKGES